MFETPLMKGNVFYYALYSAFPSSKLLPSLFPGSANISISENCISVSELWPLDREDRDDLDDLVDPPSTAFDPFLRRELFGMAGVSVGGPRFDFCCLREWRELPEESLAGEAEASFLEWRRREFFGLSEVLWVGELVGEPRLLE